MYHCQSKSTTALTAESRGLIILNSNNYKGDQMAKIYTSAEQLIGHTPLLRAVHIERAEGLKAKLLLG